MRKSENTRILVVLLLIASFFIGALITKVSYLEKNVAQTAGASTSAAQPPNPTTPQPAKVKAITSADHILSNKNAKISMIEYSDLECPFCKSVNPTMQELLKTYGDKIRLVYRHFPLSFHQNAQKEAEASECIANLGGNDKFWNFVNTVFERTTSNGLGFALDKLGPLANEVGVDQTQFQACLDSGKYEKFVKDSITEGSNAGVNGTPTTFIVDAKGNNQTIVGAQPIGAFKTAIDQALKAK